MSIFGDIFSVFAFWRTRRTSVTVEITQALIDSDAPRVINMAHHQPPAKVYTLTISTTNHGEMTEYMTSLSIDATDGSVSDHIEPEASAWPIRPREPLVTTLPTKRLQIDLKGVEFRATAHLTSGDVSSKPTRLSDALLAELEAHNLHAG